MELLTGKCKEDFEKYLITDFREKMLFVFKNEIGVTIIDKFYSLHLSLQIGVYQEFFCEKSAYPLILDYHILIMKGKTIINLRKEAILTANRLYNERTN